MTWEHPTFVEVKMDAEIGSYQEDFDPRKDPPIVGEERDAETDSA